MLSCHDIANYFLALSAQDEDSGEAISNLKMQKLAYYAQGAYLAVYGEPLFVEHIEAWTHGPVVPDLYYRFKEYGGNSIAFDQQIDLSIYDKDQREILDEVYKVFGQYSGWKLRNMTHNEPPWANTPSGGVIGHASMIDYFRTIITKDED